MDDFEESDFQDSVPSEQEIQSWENQLLQERRAGEVFKELTEGCPDFAFPSDDDPDMLDSQRVFDAHINKLNMLITNNLDSDSIWEFVFLAGDLRERLRAAEFAANKVKQASNGRRLSGATARAKIAKEERAKVEAEMRAMLSAAGVQGGKARSDRYEPIKQWALEKASKMRGEHKQIARQLHAILPKHFADISLDPERLIYEALRANSK